MSFLPTVRLLAQGQQDQQVAEPSLQPGDLLPDYTPPNIHPSAEQSGLPADYVIGPEDLLDVEVFNVPELNKTLRVANDGTISLPLLGRVKAAGFTTVELRKELEGEWGKAYLENPQVSIFVKEFHGQPVSVIGSVEKPGVYQLTRPKSLFEVLSMAGGLAKTGSPVGRAVIVSRKGGFGDLLPVTGMVPRGSDKLEIDVQRLVFSQDNALNIEVKPFDTISVSRAPIIYVLGAVGKPGGFVLNDRENITVLQALALAEGVSGIAAQKATRIIRTDDAGSRTEIPIDLGRIMKGKAKDVELAANDILYIPQSGTKSALSRGVSTTIATLSGVVVYRAAR